MPKYTKQNILDIAKEENVRYVRLQFTDMLGEIKAVEIPSSKLEDALNDQIMFDGSSIEGFVRIKEADMFLRPDFQTWLILPFEDISYGKVARLICDVYTSYGKPFIGDPRYILKRAMKKLNEIGITYCYVGFEPEFYLFKLDEKGETTLDVNDEGSYFDLAPIDGSEYVRRDIALELEKLSFDVQTSHHEVGPGQNEINFRYSDVVEACDKVQTFKQVVKVIARKHGYSASFMPKPILGMAGSGMHTNVSLGDKDGTNIFYDEKGLLKLSIICRKWMSGIIKHSSALAAVCNPSINSYKRLVPGYEAPCYACWSDANRSSMIRIPAIKGMSTRTEIRNVDPTANPYLALAAIITAGVDGIKNIKEKDLVPPVSDNIFALTKEQREEKGIPTLPENLKEAIMDLKEDKVIADALGDHTYEKYIIAKELEWDEYRKQITSWELKKYLKI